MSTYCGKNCENCSYREELNCAGCKQGPGRVIDGDCKMARCCRDNGHESCETCTNKRNCGMWLDKGTMAKQRKELIEAEAKKKEENIVMAQALAKWVKILFWLLIPLELFTILGHERVIAIFPVLELPSAVASGVVELIYAGVLYRMAKETTVYKRPALLLGIVAVLGLLGLLVPDENGWMLLISVPLMVVSFVAIYFEYTAHAAVVAPFDLELSENWQKIWKWNLYSIIGIFVSVLLVFIVPILGGLAMLGCAILLVVAFILKYVYLYRMMRLFGSYTEE